MNLLEAESWYTTTVVLIEIIICLALLCVLHRVNQKEIEERCLIQFKMSFWFVRIGYYCFIIKYV